MVVRDRLESIIIITCLEKQFLGWMEIILFLLVGLSIILGPRLVMR